MHGLCLSPYVEGQAPGSLVDEAQIRARLGIIRPYTRWVRSFSCTDGHERTPRIAHELGLKSLAGAWLGTDREINEREIAGAIEVARAGHVDILAVGNEVLLREDMSEDELLGYMQRVKQPVPPGMPPELATGMIRPSAISIPLRMMCKKTEFIQAKVSSIDLKSKLVAITRPFDGMVKILSYDYLVIAMGGTTNFFGNRQIEKHAFTIKTIQDAIGIKTHLIHMLEIGDTEKNPVLQEKLLTVVVVGAAFAGVETIGELNDFIKDSVKSYYRNINPENIKMILVSASDKILPELGDELGKKAYQSLQKIWLILFKAYGQQYQNTLD